jgi:3-hydroxyisobutyrate dehydrogenase-like beta-hydroxyacid dehydrogenase
VAEGAVAASSPAGVVQQADITFGMLADPEAALKVCKCSNTLGMIKLADNKPCKQVCCGCGTLLPSQLLLLPVLTTSLGSQLVWV